jgi:clan AA aspartic protease
VIEGVFRAGHPRVILSLPARDGGTIDLEFIVDTGFEGDLCVNEPVLQQLDAAPAGARNNLLADGTLLRTPVYQMYLPFGDEERWVQVVVLPGNLLLGTTLLQDHLLSIELKEGGEVLAEPL